MLFRGTPTENLTKEEDRGISKFGPCARECPLDQHDEYTSASAASIVEKLRLHCLEREALFRKVVNRSRSPRRVWTCAQREFFCRGDLIHDCSYLTRSTHFFDRQNYGPYFSSSSFHRFINHSQNSFASFICCSIDSLKESKGAVKGAPLQGNSLPFR